MIYALCVSVFLTCFHISALSLELGFLSVSPGRISRIITIALFLGLLLKERRLPGISKAGRYPVLFWLCFVLFSACSYFWSKDTHAWLKNTCSFAIGFIYLIIFLDTVKSAASLRLLLGSFSLGIVMHNIIAWYQAISGNYILSDKTFSLSSVSFLYTPVSTQNNPNNLSLLLVFGIAACLVLFLMLKKPALKAACVLLAASSAFLIYLGASRACLLALGLMAATVPVAVLPKKKALVFCGILMAVAVAGFLVLPPLRSVVTEFKEIVQGTSSNTSDTIRWNLGLSCLHYTKETHGLGLGAGQFQYYMENFPTEYFTGHIIKAHSWFAELLVNFGVLPFLGYLVFYVKLILDFLRKKQSPLSKYMRGVLAGLLVGNVIGSISPGTLSNTMWYHLLFGILTAAAVLPPDGNGLSA